MELTAKQEEAVKTIIQRFKSKQKYAVVSGYAGVGKTTVIRFVIEALSSYGIYEEDVAYVSYTGKAAQVLIEKGNTNAMTLHKLLYFSKQMPTGEFAFRRKPAMKIPYKVIVVDECSMCPNEIVADLMRLSAFLIFCGDPGQLPPITKTDGDKLLDHPHVFLDEVMRQAKDSGIIRLSMDIREGKNISGFYSDEAVVLPMAKMSAQMLDWADQVLCATNETRKSLNLKIKSLKGFGEKLTDGDKVISLHNHWDYVGSEGNPLINGIIGTLHSPHERMAYCPGNRRVKFEGRKYPAVNATFISDLGDKFEGLLLDGQIFKDGNRSFSDEDTYRMKKWSETEKYIPLAFDYGYAITVWKAQGSEFEKVVVLEEGHPFDKTEHQQYLYTAVTRASKNVILLQE